MRSSFIDGLKLSDQYVISGDALHHLVHVVRIEPEEQILLLDGKGLQVLAVVETITKKEMRLKHLESRVVSREFNFDLALGMPKKEALELCLKQATELGFRKILLIRSAYSQMKMPEAERIQSLLVSALEQSNGAYLPEVSASSWESQTWSDYSQVFMMDSQTKDGQKNDSLSKQDSQLLVIGPEGGFSPEEITLLHSQAQTRILRLPTPILRSPTAVAAGAGFMLKCLLD